MNMQKIINQNKAMVYSGVIAILGVIVVLVTVHREVDRFIFIMPIFAGWILFNILLLPDDEEAEEMKETHKSTSGKKKK